MYAQIRQKLLTVKRRLDVLVRWFNQPAIPSGKDSIHSKPEEEIIFELRKMNGVLGKLEKCLSDSNHKKQMCLKTGHWND